MGPTAAGLSWRRTGQTGAGGVGLAEGAQDGGRCRLRWKGGDWRQRLSGEVQGFGAGVKFVISRGGAYLLC